MAKKLSPLELREYVLNHVKGLVDQWMEENETTEIFGCPCCVGRNPTDAEKQEHQELYWSGDWEGSEGVNQTNPDFLKNWVRDFCRTIEYNMENYEINAQNIWRNHLNL